MEHILYLLEHYKYFILFPLAVIEGPILAILAGFLCSTGVMNPLFVYPIIVLGDTTGDSICYLAGRSGNQTFLKRIIRRVGVSAEQLNKVSGSLSRHPVKTISLSKIILGIGVAGIYLAGLTRVPYYRFIRVCVLTSMIQYSVYLTIGILSGSAYKQINHYLNFFSAVSITAAAATIAFLFIRSIRKRI